MEDYYNILSRAFMYIPPINYNIFDKKNKHKTAIKASKVKKKTKAKRRMTKQSKRNNR